ncbi:MAG: hypothetical protein MUC95_01610 [Spirochaetes bacterium]|jgi:hypothetical protein|nr:hypothetical protein [Spirochaetota bacterium]
MTFNRSCISAYIILSVLFLLFSCGGETETNQQPIDQYNLDNSNNYKYIFRDIIRKNREKEEKYKKGPFDE